MKKKEKKEKEKSYLWRNLKMTWKLTKGSRRYLFGVIILSIVLSVIGGILPTFSGKQVIFVSDRLWDKLIYVTLVILALEISINIFRNFDFKWGNIFYRETLKKIQIELASETVKLETEEIDNNTTLID